jgi:hypothetical protein
MHVGLMNISGMVAASPAARGLPGPALVPKEGGGRSAPAGKRPLVDWILRPERLGRLQEVFEALQTLGRS